MNTLEQNMQLNTFTGGMNMDFDPNVIPSDKYCYAENVRIVANDEGSAGSITNSDGVEDIFQIDFTKFPYVVNNDSGVACSIIYDVSKETIIHRDKIRNFGLIFTENKPLSPYDKNNGTINRIFRIDFTKDPATEPDKFFVKLAESQYNIKTPVSSSTIYESDTNIKIYWADGFHQIRSINIVPELAFPDDGGADYYITDNSSDSADIIPPFPKNKLIPDNIVSGGLICGSYQYVYVLITPSSVMTSASVPSDMIQLYPYAYSLSDTSGDSTHSKQALGGQNNQDSGCGIHMNVTLPYNMWSRYSFIKVYRLFYSDENSSPTCFPIISKSVTKGKNKEDVVMEFLDQSTDAVIGSAATDLYATESNYKYSFAPRFLEQKNNMLFAANIKNLNTSEDILGVSDNGEVDSNGNPTGLDFRAYPFNINGEVDIAHSIGGSTTKYTIKDPSASNYVTHIPKSSDCYLDHDSLTNHELVSSNTDSAATNSSFYGYRFYKDQNGNWQHCLGGSGHIISYEFIVKQIIIDGNNGAEHNGLIQDNNFSIYKTKQLCPINSSGSRNVNTVIGNFKADYNSKNIDTAQNSLVNYVRTEYDSSIGLGTSVNKEYEPQYSYNSITKTSEPFGYQTKQLEGRDYTNPFISASYKSLRRDEIYRYGIVFRSNGGTKTNVFWIGDIKTPCASVIPYFEHISNDSECVIAANVLGIRFIIDFDKLNVALGNSLGSTQTIDSYEIVRCKRTKIDRTVVASGVILSLFPDAGINDRESKNGNYYQPTWFTSSNGRIDTFCPTRVDINKDTTHDLFKVDHTVNHGFKYDEVSGYSGTIYPNINNARLKYVGFASPDIEYNMNGFNSDIDVSSGATSTKSTITNLLDNITGCRLVGSLSLTSAVSDSISNQTVYINKDSTTNYYTGCYNFDLFNALLGFSISGVLSVQVPIGADLSTRYSQNKKLSIKTMGTINYKNITGTEIERDSYGGIVELIGLDYYKGLKYTTDQNTAVSRGYVSDDGTTFYRRIPSVNIKSFSVYSYPTGTDETVHIDGYVNSGCSDGSGCGNKLLFKAGKVVVVKELYGGKTIVDSSGCAAAFGGMSGGHLMLSRYYYPTGIVSIKNATDSGSKTRGSGYSVVSPSSISMNINDYAYLGVESVSRGKWDSTGGPSSFYAMNGSDYFRNVSIMTYATGTWIDSYGEFDVLNVGIGKDDSTGVNIFMCNSPILGMTGANIKEYDSTNADASTRLQKQRVRTCPSHGGMLVMKMEDSGMSENMIIGAGAKLKYGFLNGSYTNPCDTPYDSTVVLVANIKRLSKNAYTGQTKNLRDSYSTYYSFGDVPHNFKDNGVWSIPLFYGDTYINIFDYTSSYLTRDEANKTSGTLNSAETNKLLGAQFGSGKDSPFIGTYGVSANMFSTETISVQHQAYIPIESDINISLSSQFDPHKNVMTMDGSSYGLMDNVKVTDSNPLTDFDSQSGGGGSLVNGHLWDNLGTGVARYAEAAHGVNDSIFNDTKNRVSIGYKYVNNNGVQYTCNKSYSAAPIYCTSVASIAIASTDATNSGTFDCRVLYSSQKKNNEVEDSYGIFTYDDKIDVDTRYGPITGLNKFKNNLLFWQDTAFGYLPVLERTFMKSSDQNSSTGEAEIVLGTGSVLKSFDYYTTENGMSHRIIDVNGDYKYVSGTYTSSESALYWYDHNKKEVVMFTGGINPLSKAKGIQSYINKYCDEFAPRLSFDYDNKYNEVLMTFRTIDDDDEYILGSISSVFEATTYAYEIGYKDTSIINDIITSTVNGANKDFVITSSPDWCTVSIVNDDNVYSINITPSKNTEYYNRTGYIVLTQNDTKKTITIVVSQSLYNPEIVFSASPTSFTLAAGLTASRSSAVKSTIDGDSVGWTATTSDSWITISTNSGTNNSKVVFNCSVNDLTSVRTGKITLTQSGTDLIVNITVVQNEAELVWHPSIVYQTQPFSGLKFDCDLGITTEISTIDNRSSYVSSNSGILSYDVCIHYTLNGDNYEYRVTLLHSLNKSNNCSGFKFTNSSCVFNYAEILSTRIYNNNSGSITEDSDNYYCDEGYGRSFVINKTPTSFNALHPSNFATNYSI